ncbi:uncharacterized protein LOC121749272 [Salvia splendens]|uniref:uncharacterized protein LOC121749272 n=1 Tax=Salvia splendens TaxID=180675 RepID=UPI001C2787EB|nr:uncharacterized protein LOC121749272 [Salvia splendens]
MLTRSLQSTNKKPPSKKQCPHNSPPLFDCDCFHCYTSFWFRWDSSPNRELIHQAIKAFEDHLNSSDSLNNSPKTKHRDKLALRNKPLISSLPKNQEIPISSVEPPPDAEADGDELATGVSGKKEMEDNCVAEPAARPRTHKWAFAVTNY